MTWKILEKNLNYEFKNHELLIEALTHKSFCINDNKKRLNNERLEFLGDALLGFVLAELLMELYPNDNEGVLSKKRASLVNQDVLAKKALKFNLDKLLVMGPGEKEQESNLKPRILCSVFEAVLGAMYLDSDVGLIKKWIYNEFNTEINLIKPELEFERDYKTRLQELAQKLKLGVPEYKLIDSTGPSHNPEFKVGVYLNENNILVEKFFAVGKSKKSAEQSAAEQLLKSLENFKLKGKSV